MWRYEKLPSFTVIKNSTTPSFLKVNEVATVLPLARLVFVARFVSRKTRSPARLPPPPLLPEQGVNLHKAYPLLHHPPPALSCETQASYIELHGEHNTSTNAQCK